MDACSAKIRPNKYFFAFVLRLASVEINENQEKRPYHSAVVCTASRFLVNTDAALESRNVSQVSDATR